MEKIEILITNVWGIDDYNIITTQKIIDIKNYIDILDDIDIAYNYIISFKLKMKEIKELCAVIGFPKIDGNKDMVIRELINHTVGVRSYEKTLKRVLSSHFNTHKQIS